MANDSFLKRKGDYNPDVLSCLANLSNDEVFTPPDLVNKMLDLLYGQRIKKRSFPFGVP